MAKPEVAGVLNELRSVSLYKRNQGRMTRQLTAGTVIVVALFGAYRLSLLPSLSSSEYARVGIPLAFLAGIAWLAFRLVNIPKFAEFLISVEAEMAKVSWPGRQELTRATSVVIGSMVFLTLVLFLFDAFWAWLLTALGFVLT
ncbi:MAG: preprotein translocase subunit SecE [Planctomycetota bacterium]|nr:preprotein translocase subunit SecE [Planctomycetota bacterium]